MAVFSPTRPVRADGAPAVPGAARAREALRPEIQALRALAVSVVVAYHLFPSAIPGGFIGVDVFFAISGFLISAHLLREVDRSGRVGLAAFWARRARRILPAALLVLLACALATLLWVPQDRWGQYLAEIRASTAYVQNWRLASDAVDYLAAANAPSPVQHFWSLSAEEQFYLAWPVLIGLAAWTTRARGPRARRAAITVTLGVAAALSFAYCLWDTHADQARAFFVTPTRAWEFAAGGLLAAAGAIATRRDGARAALSWAGLALIAFGVLRLSGATPFPGSAALIPVLGALMVMAAGAPRHRLAPTRGLALAPVQWLGGVSYSVYLWHWPLLVLWPYALGGAGPGAWGKLGLVGATLLLAWMTKHLVEDPVRTGAWLRRRRAGWTFAAVLLGTACVLAVVTFGQRHLDATVQRDTGRAAQAINAPPRCFGAASVDTERPCVNPRLRTTVVPTPAAAANFENQRCTRVVPFGIVRPCAFGVPAAGARQTFAIVGDSHAAHWRAALEVVARGRGWHGISIARTSCPFSQATRAIVEPDRARCVAWNAAVPRWFRRHPEIHTVFVAAISGAAVVVPRGRSRRDVEVTGYERAMRSLPPSVRQIVVLRDTPEVHGDTASCVTAAIARHVDAGAACAVLRAGAIRFDPQVAAAGRVGARVRVVDLDDVLCGARRCRAVIGGVLVYKDVHHFTRIFATTLGPLLERRLAFLPTTTG